MRSRQISKVALCLVFLLVLPAIASSARAAWVVDETGRRVFVPAHPRRIVSLAPDITETLFALGLDREIVGVSQFSDYPEAARTKPKVGSYVNLSLERILSLSPDLVIGTTNGNRKEAVALLEKAGIPVYVTNPERFSDIFRMILHLGTITGREGTARQLAASMKKRADRIAALTASCRKPKVFVQIDSNPLLSVGRNTIYHELITLAGGTNIVGHVRVKYPRYSMESLLKARPEVILVSSMGGDGSRKAVLDAWSRWPDLPAVRNSRIYLLDSDLTDRFSPRIVLGLEKIAEILHQSGSSRLLTRGNRRAAGQSRQRHTRAGFRGAAEAATKQAPRKEWESVRG